MTTPIDIPANETGRIRVFAISRPPDDMAHLLSLRSRPEVARDLLRAPELETGSVEIFPLSDLGELGLAGYLNSGYGVETDQLNRDRSKLAALDGYVLLLFSESFARKAIVLSPDPELTLIGTYVEPQADMHDGPIETASAEPYSGPQRPSFPTNTAGQTGAISLLVVTLLLLAAGLWGLLN